MKALLRVKVGSEDSATHCEPKQLIDDGPDSLSLPVTFHIWLLKLLQNLLLYLGMGLIQPPIGYQPCFSATDSALEVRMTLHFKAVILFVHKTLPEPCCRGHSRTLQGRKLSGGHFPLWWTFFPWDPSSTVKWWEENEWRPVVVRSFSSSITTSVAF